jgi:hypothetical protein
MDINVPKPIVDEALSIKPITGVVESKPTLDADRIVNNLQTFDVVLAAGMAVGIPGQTYPEEITVVSTKTT